MDGERPAEDLDAWLALVAATRTVFAAVDTQLRRESAINFFDYSVLSALSAESGGAASMSRLAQLTSSSPTRLSNAVGRLEHAGWVERTSDPARPRGVEARITAAGVTKLAEATPGHVHEWRRRVVDVLSPSQLAALGEACHEIVASSAEPRG